MITCSMCLSPFANWHLSKDEASWEVDPEKAVCDSCIARGSPPTIKTGDTVLCVENKGFSQILRKDHVYVVLSVTRDNDDPTTPDLLNLNNVQKNPITNGDWNARMFRRITIHD